MAKVLTRHCPICDCCGGHVVYRVPADGILAECDVVTCNKCGFCFSDTPTTQEEFDRYYAECKKYGPETTGANGWNKDRYAKTARRICSLFEPVGKFIDIGCGRGGLLEAMADFEWQSLVGLEQSQWWDAEWNFDRRYILRKGSITTQHPVADPFTCASVCHILEHVRDLDPAIRNLAAIAKTVYAEVPDAARYCDFCDSPYQQFNSEHINHFTAEHLRQLFEQHGFAQVASGRGECGDPPPRMSPYIWGFFERRHLRAKDPINLYCQYSVALWEQIECKVRQLNGPLAMWGCGQLALKLWPLVRDKVSCVVDSTCKEWQGKSVGAPGLLKQVTYPILVTTIQHRESVLADIKRLELKNEVITLP